MTLLVDVMFQRLHNRSVTSILALAKGHLFPSGRCNCSDINYTLKVRKFGLRSRNMAPTFANKSLFCTTNKCISSNPNTPVLPNSRWGTSDWSKWLVMMMTKDKEEGTLQWNRVFSIFCYRECRSDLQERHPKYRWAYLCGEDYALILLFRVAYWYFG